MLEAVIGRAGSGKTELLIARIARAVEADPLGPPIWFIVPDHVTFAMEERLARAVAGNALLRVQVVSLRRLARKALVALGADTRTPLREAGKYALIAAICEQATSQMQVLGQHGWPAHIIERLLAFVQECQRQQVTGTQLYQAVEQLSQQPMLQAKLCDLAYILEAYLSQTNGQWLDSLELLPALAQHVENSPLFAQATIYLDGFVSFSPQEWSVIAAFCQPCTMVSVAIAAPSQWSQHAVFDEACAQPLAHPFAEAADMLARLERIGAHHASGSFIVTAVKDEACRRFAESPVLAHLERHLYAAQGSAQAGWSLSGFANSDSAAQAADPIVFARAASVQAEVAGTIRGLIAKRRASNRWRDMAIIVPTLDEYGAPLEEALREAGIPYYMDVRRSIERHPLSVYVLSALRLAIAKTDEAALWGLLKSDLFPLSRSLVDALENEYLRGGWRPFHDADPKRKSFARVDAIFTLLLQPFLSSVQEGASVRQVAHAIWMLLVRGQVAKRLERLAEADDQAGQILDARLHERAWTAVLDILDELVAVFGDQVLPLAVLHTALQRALAGVTIGTVPATVDQVLITAASRIRAIEVDHVFALGCADGAFPARAREDDLLADSERNQMAKTGVALAETSVRRQLYERYRVYLALTRARRSLVLSCPTTDTSGRALTPSLLLTHVRSLFPPAACQDVYYPDELTGQPTDVVLLTTPKRAAFWLAEALGQARRDGHLPALWHSVYKAFASGHLPQEMALRELAGLAHSLPEQDIEPALAKGLYGTHLQGSVSRLERFASCGFAHFAEYGLRLRDRERLHVDAGIRGTLAHDALRRFTEAVSLVPGAKWDTWSDEQIEAHAQTAFALALQAPGAASFHTSARARQEALQVYRAFLRAALSLTEHARRGAFQPALLEVGFGRAEDPLPALVIALADGRTVQLRGQIDRVDVAREGNRLLYRIVDYKSADKQVRLDLTYHGLELQLIVYARVIEQLGHTILGKPHEWAGCFYFPVRDGIVSVASPTPEDRTAPVLRTRLRMRGLVRKEALIVDLLDRRARLHETDLFAKLLKTNGEFDKRALAATQSQWDALGAWAEQLVALFADRIFAGDARINPYKKGASKTACDLCALQALCRFEPLAGSGQYRVLPSMSAHVIWEQLGVVDEEGAGVDE